MEPLIGSLRDLGVGESENTTSRLWLIWTYQKEMFNLTADSLGNVSGDGKRCYSTVEGKVYEKGCSPEDSEHFFKIT